MKRILSIAALIVLAAQVATQAQTQPAQPKSLSATMNVYVFPSKGQSASAQSKDEAECYQWAVKNTGTDPFELTKQAQAQQQQAQAQAQAAQGSGARGAARGAAGGALIGAIAGDAGTGAAVGAAAGAVAGRSRRRQAEAQAQQQTQSTQKATAQQMDNFKKAFSVCLEAKHYMVKY
ncbi:MAG: glycine zipper family protein [Acidobacteriota bacterium]